MHNNGRWSSPPPNYLPIMNGLGLDNNNSKGDNDDGNSNSNSIITTSGVSNLETYISMLSNDDDDGDDDVDDRWGKVYSLDQFRARYC